MFTYIPAGSRTLLTPTITGTPPQVPADHRNFHFPAEAEHQLAHLILAQDDSFPAVLTWWLSNVSGMIVDVE